ncbi:MAG: isoprenylcysteine carboxylmethyltransferase family protein [Gemmatimonadota bacterium]|nr:isoprenylcysteine carboxylmethyltransferase family protein [Gemmatimonadota bacterium]MDE3004973.1 isoprenylcysteine carboxylmethyltransferase family protein [Gemmatimonadota bacterium]MDE3012943.1 isoprenylcysteine carboxylmethyltransferase family protein [Gemmatimonadota bacterium]
MRQLRLKTVWLIVIPFFWFAAPTPNLLAAGSLLAVCGLWIRGWSAGTIHKDQEVATTGPYAFTRNPLYLGSFFIGAGVSLAGGHWVWPALFLTFYALVYSRAMTGEVRHLTELFPEAYGEYAANVPFFVPRRTPWRGSSAGGEAREGFRWAQYRRNKEWEASVGVLATFVALGAKVVFGA